MVSTFGRGERAARRHRSSRWESSTRVIAPQVQTAGSALVASTVSSCNQVNAFVDGSPFIALTFENDDDTAYYVAPTGGSYGASWTSMNATWNASTVAFH